MPDKETVATPAIAPETTTIVPVAGKEIEVPTPQGEPEIPVAVDPFAPKSKYFYSPTEEEVKKGMQESGKPLVHGLPMP